MSDVPNTQANVQSQRHISTIWIIPILALVMGIWMLYQHISSTGPEITLKMQTAEGIEAGKTEIRALNVKVGTVTSVTLSDDYNSILVTARMQKDAERMLKEDSRFWVVKPRIGREGVSGLDTLLSGSYIQLQPGHAEKQQDKFTVLDVPPVAPPDAKGLRVVLTNQEAGKLSVGDPVIYKGFTVGRVESTTFNVKTRQALYQLFIFSPYNGLVSTRSHFWLSSGVDLQMNAEGFNLKFGTLESLVTGGVTFDIPTGMDAGQPITEPLTQFRLFDDQKQVREGLYDDYLEYVVLFDESVRGLKAGAPVEFRGLRIGTVMRVPMRMPKPAEDFSPSQIPVLIRIELGRVYDSFEQVPVTELKAKLHEEFKRGLRATLKTGNLLTGALYIDADFYPKAKAVQSDDFEGYNVFPSQTGGFAEVQKQVTDLLQKLNELPVDKTLESLNATLQTSQKTLASAERVASSLETLLNQKDSQSLPSDIRASLKQIQSTLDGFGPNSTMYSDLQATLNEFEQAMAEFKPVMSQLKTKPNSLVFGKPAAQDPEPTKGQK